MDDFGPAVLPDRSSSISVLSKIGSIVSRRGSPDSHNAKSREEAQTRRKLLASEEEEDDAGIQCDQKGSLNV